MNAPLRDRHARPVVAVTGVGVITSLGQGLADNWAAVTAGKSGIHRIGRFSTDNLKTTIAGSVEYLHPEPVLPVVLTERLAREAAEEAVAMSGIGAKGRFPGPLFMAVPPVEVEWSTRKKLFATPAAPAGDTYARMIGAVGALNAAEDDLTVYCGVADAIAERFGTEGLPISLTTACASGGTAIQLGIEAIRRGDCSAALVVGADGSIQAESLIRFSLLSALSTANEIPAEAVKPFSKNRDGFVMAEGAGALVLEDYGAAKARGATILAVLAGSGEKADDFHRTRSKPDGSAIIGAIRNAIADAGLAPDDIGYVNAHGTGTPENDKMEALSLEAVLGERMKSVPISSNKSMVGHTLTAAGAVEAVLTVQTIRTGIIPPTINYRVPDPAIEFDVVPNVARRSPVTAALSNSFGFGGQNVCLVVTAEPV
ncbi:MAG: beta-ketoacyl-ACP synthase [Bauldia sp.]